MKKNILILVLMVIGVSCFAQVRVGILNGPSCVPVSYLMENIVSIQNEDLDFTQYPEAQTLVPKLLKGEIDIGFLPVNVAAKLYNTGKQNILCAAVTGQGNITLITKDKNLKSFKDLSGKKIFVAGQGATPDFLTKYFLEQNNINDAELSFSIPTAQLAAQLISGKIEYAVVPEPFSTIAIMKDSDVFNALDFQAEFRKYNPTSENYPLTVMVCTKQFAEEKNNLLNEFLKLYKEAYEYTLSDPYSAAELCERLGFGIKANILEKSIKKANYVYIPGNQAKDDVEMLLNIFLSSDASSIGGILPDEKFYY